METYGHGGDVFAYDAIRYDFSVNINPLGMPEAVKKAVCEHIGDYETYPDTKSRALRTAIAQMEGVDPDNIICGNGAADLIYKLCLSNRPKNVLVCAPSFSEYERAALLSGASVRYHTLREEDGFTLTAAILEDITCDTDMIFLCSPNNPTGKLIANELISLIADKAEECGSLLVLDECFLEFTTGQSSKFLLNEFMNLVILKAFTKIYAMAGLRLGYLICSDIALLEKANDYGQCWSVSSVAQNAGVAACALDGFVLKTQELIAKERVYLSGGLRVLGIKVLDSDANFLLIRSIKTLKDMLVKKGILIRSCDNFKGLDNRYFRVAVKTREANTALLEAIKEIFL